ncbi:hypothetical protein VTL71DRAFT_11660 [Oculimacula yallundae]|uniref:Uncharacterized protein n=1 Tax=Oculimacula yallundae TaxID=86028 RepID=A0ABR4CRW2_9HELO
MRGSQTQCRMNKRMLQTVCRELAISERASVRLIYLFRCTKEGRDGARSSSVRLGEGYKDSVVFARRQDGVVRLSKEGKGRGKGNDCVGEPGYL